MNMLSEFHATMKKLIKSCRRNHHGNRDKKFNIKAKLCTCVLFFLPEILFITNINHQFTIHVHVQYYMFNIPITLQFRAPYVSMYTHVPVMNSTCTCMHTVYQPIDISQSGNNVAELACKHQNLLISSALLVLII